MSERRAPEDPHQGRACLDRYGRWGTCVDCPRRDGVVYPEECENTDRYDHRLTEANHITLVGLTHRHIAEGQIDALVARAERAEAERDDLLDPEDTIGRIWQERAEKAEARLATVRALPARWLGVVKTIGSGREQYRYADGMERCADELETALGETVEGQAGRIERLRAVVRWVARFVSHLPAGARNALDALKPGDLPDE